MFLLSVEVKNYRSLEHVKLDGLSRFNVLIGRNNAGKSSVFGALALLSKTVTSYGTPIQWDRVLTDLDLSRSLEISLTFEPHYHERKEFIEILRTEGQTKERRDQLLDGPLLRQLTFFFRTSAGQPNRLHLRETRLLTEDSSWAVVQRMTGLAHEDTPANRVTVIEKVSERLPFGTLNKASLDADSAARFGGASLADEWHLQSFPFQVAVPQSQAITWLRTKLVDYLRNAFFFSPFRHSSERLAAQEQPNLAQDGSNLAQVLKTIEGDDRSRFEDIESFVHGALPDVGKLHVPFVSGTSNIEVDFRSPVGDYRTRLYEMGGGVEQLLMAATVLLTTGDTSTLFLEEPESHLHAGAQRFLIEQLYNGNRQVFVTTHSPTFVNLSRTRSLYQVRYDRGRTNISEVRGADSLGTVLEDIGARNSDVLLSDAVLFVEGPSDEQALSIWSETLGMSLAERNVTPLTMGGGEYAYRQAPIRSDVLTGISQRAPVPHLFVLDRDQRSLAEVSELEQRLEGRAYVLRARELENYLLVPRALREALRSKAHTNHRMLEQLNRTSDEDMQQLIQESADNLYGQVLLKRIRAELGGLRGGLLTREAVGSLATENNYESLAERVYQAVDEQVSPHLIKSGIEQLVLEQKEALDNEWSEPSQRLIIAPGEEILDGVYSTFGVRYKKRSDTERIAYAMRMDEIAPEISELVAKAVVLTEQQSA